MRSPASSPHLRSLTPASTVNAYPVQSYTMPAPSSASKPPQNQSVHFKTQQSFAFYNQRQDLLLSARQSQRPVHITSAGVVAHSVEARRSPIGDAQTLVQHQSGGLTGVDVISLGKGQGEGQGTRTGYGNYDGKGEGEGIPSAASCAKQDFASFRLQDKPPAFSPETSAQLGQGSQRQPLKPRSPASSPQSCLRQPLKPQRSVAPAESRISSPKSIGRSRLRQVTRTGPAKWDGKQEREGNIDAADVPQVQVRAVLLEEMERRQAEEQNRPPGQPPSGMRKSAFLARGAW